MRSNRVRKFLVAISAAAALTIGLAQQNLVIATGTDAVTLDVHAITDTPTFNITGHIFERLFRLTPEGDIVPHLAADYEITDDGTVVTLALREGVSFHDGTPFNSEAVKLNIERIQDPELPHVFAVLVSNIVEVRTPDELTVELILEGPFAPLLPHLTHASLGMMAPSSFDDPELFEHPVGTGPFKLDTWVRGQELVLARNDDYWRAPSALDSITFRPVPEGATRLGLVETGVAHVATNVPPQDVDRIDALPGVSVVKADSMRTIYILFNHAREPYTDVRVRQAINHAIDKQAIVDFVLGGAGRVSDAAIAPGVFGYSPIGVYDYDPERAKELLAEAGFPDGLELTLHSPTGRYMQDIQISEAVQSYLADVGIKATIKTLEWSSYLADIARPKDEAIVELAQMGWGVSTGDADQGLYNVLHGSQHTPNGSNRAFYDNAEFNSLLEQGRVEIDIDARKEIYEQALQVAFEDAAWLFLHSERQLVAVRDNVKGLQILPTETIDAYEVVLD